MELGLQVPIPHTKFMTMELSGSPGSPIMAEPSIRHGISETWIRAWPDHPCRLTRVEVDDTLASPNAHERAQDVLNQTFHALQTP